MQDQWGRVITQTKSEDGLWWIFTRDIGGSVEYPSSMDLDVAIAAAINSFNGMQPE